MRWLIAKRADIRHAASRDDRVSHDPVTLEGSMSTILFNDTALIFFSVLGGVAASALLAAVLLPIC